ncbi:hypothetical protein JXB31_04100 [Candidatus Woesearchaeota archaeon]|nr:hypothetical protein [Candidatus Woesearchaeota archaeon]
MIKKKGLLFTALTLMILGALLVATMAFVNRSEKVEERFNGGVSVFKINKLMSDLAQDYCRIFNIDMHSIGVIHDSAYVNLTFYLSSLNPDPKEILEDYIEYIEDNFSVHANINISLDMAETFEIYPYGTSCKANSTIFSAAISPDDILKIGMVVKVSTMLENLSDSYVSTEPGDTLVMVKVLDRNDKEIIVLDDSLDISGTNIIYVEFNASTPYPRFTLNLSGGLMAAHIKDNINSSVEMYLEFNSSTKNKIYINTGENTIFRSGVGDFVKQGPLELMSG